jgi:hypothetical protein
MYFIRLIPACAALCFAMTTTAQPTSSPYVGKWQWNQAQSTLVPGEPPPRGIVLNITSIGGNRITWTLTATDPSGQPHTENFDGPSDGTPTKVGGVGNGGTASFTVSGGVLKAVFNGPDGGSDSWSCGLSADQRKMTCRGAESDGKGHSQPYTDVYDRG